MSGAEQEQMALDAWMRLHKPHLVGNYQEDGGYYVEVLQWGDDDIPAEGNDYGSEPIMLQDTCWMFTDIVGRTLDGDVYLTRTPELAEMNGTFSYNTHYTPYLNYCGDVNLGLLEGTYLATRNDLTLSDEYLAEYWPDKGDTFRMRRGSKVRLYMTSTIAYGEEGSSVQGGYEGQYSLSPNIPTIMDIDVKRTIKNPSDLELDMVATFVNGFSDWRQVPEKEEYGEDEEVTYLKGLYYNLNYNPRTAVSMPHRYQQSHLSGVNNPYRDTKKYADMDAVERKISEIFLERFGEAMPTSDMTDENLVTKENSANVWYVVRFLDGFIVDTNIDELREYIYNDKSAAGKAFSYRAKDDDNKSEGESLNAIGAWYYCIPRLHFGQYAAIVTTSGYAYGISGISGTTSTTTDNSNVELQNYLAMANYYNYYNYYYYGYGDYYNYYDYSNYAVSDNTAESTTTTVGTEILPYTPLVFYLYVEPKQD